MSNSQARGSTVGRVRWRLRDVATKEKERFLCLDARMLRRRRNTSKTPSNASPSAISQAGVCVKNNEGEKRRRTREER